MLPAALLLAAITASDFAGAGACKDCHPSQYRSQSATAHAAALARSRPDQPGDWAFGAGSQAITFVSRVGEDHYMEHGESWYPKIQRYGPTPGQLGPGGVRYRVFDPAAGILRCFSCHSTGPVSLDAKGAIQPHELGVRCEDCHGPSAAHARDPARIKPLNPSRLNAVDLNNLCGSCHRMPMGADATPDLRNPWNARHQPLLLAASACFERSRKLSCLTCHDPHQPVERNARAYDAACKNCHVQPKHSTATGNQSCTECHMPAVKPQAGLSFANHRIGVYRP